MKKCGYIKIEKFIFVTFFFQSCQTFKQFLDIKYRNGSKGTRSFLIFNTFHYRQAADIKTVLPAIFSFFSLPINKTYSTEVPSVCQFSLNYLYLPSESEYLIRSRISKEKRIKEFLIRNLVFAEPSLSCSLFCSNSKFLVFHER